MSRTIGSIAAFVGAGALVASLGGSVIETIAAQQPQQEKIEAILEKMPPSILAKYHSRSQIGAMYTTGGIGHCTKNNQTIYVVSLRGQRGPMLQPKSTFHEESYFRANGELIGSVSVNNGTVGDAQLESLRQSGAKLPSDFNEYSCNALMGFATSVLTSGK